MAARSSGRARPPRSTMPAAAMSTSSSTAGPMARSRWKSGERERQDPHPPAKTRAPPSPASRARGLHEIISEPLSRITGEGGARAQAREGEGRRLIMAKPSSRYVCQSCGGVQSKWSGRCEACGAWNTVVEEPRGEALLPKGQKLAGARKLEFSQLVGDSVEPPRRQTGIAEFDRVCGGGLVAGSAVLIGGDPGIGKSTLLLQVVA